MKRRSSLGSTASGVRCCECFVIILAFNLLVGGWSVRILTELIWGRAIEWGWAILAGLFAGEVTFPAAIVGLILKAAGVHFPLVH